MQDGNKKQSEEILAEIYRNGVLACESIHDILPATENEKLRAEFLREYEEYEKLNAKACLIAKNKGLELKEPSGMKKAMMWGSIKMNTLTNNEPNHLVDMMLKGTLMGITALRTSQNDAMDGADEEVLALLQELIELEEGFEKKLKEFL